ncbi:unnamed protein product [Ectocarpus fasciculatus]
MSIIGEPYSCLQLLGVSSKTPPMRTVCVIVCTCGSRRISSFLPPPPPRPVLSHPAASPPARNQKPSEHQRRSTRLYCS